MDKIYGIIVVSSTKTPANGMNKVVLVANEHLVKKDVIARIVTLNSLCDFLCFPMFYLYCALRMKSLRPSFVVFNSLASLNVQNRYGLLVARLLSKLAVMIYIYWHETSYVFEKEDNLNRDSMKAIDEFIGEQPVFHLAVSGACADYLRKRYGDIKVKTIYNCTDMPDVDNVTIGPPVSPPMVMNIASVQDRKGPDLFVETAQKVIEKHETVEFVWVGGGQDLGKWQDRMKRDSLQHRIKFIGSVEPGSALLRFASVFFLSSRDDPFPLSVLEAMALGKTVIAFDVGGAPEALLDGGIVLPAFDTERAAQVVLEEICKPGEGLINQYAHERYYENFTPQKFADRLSSVLMKNA